MSILSSLINDHSYNFVKELNVPLCIPYNCSISEVQLPISVRKRGKITKFNQHGHTAGLSSTKSTGADALV